MKSWKNTSIYLSPSAMCVLLSGCLFGENKTFFDYKTGTNGAGGDEPVVPDDAHLATPSLTITGTLSTTEVSSGTSTTSFTFTGTETETGTSSGTTTSTSTLTNSNTFTLTGTSTSTTSGTSTSTLSTTATGTSTGTNTGTCTSTPTPSPSPSYGLCCNINTGSTVPASEMGCNRGVALFPVATAEECSAMVVSPSPTPSLVCDPFENEATTGDSKNGIKAKLYYYNTQTLRSHPYSGVNDFLNYGKAANADLYFNNIFTPTRAFDRGFAMSDGSVLKNDEGTPLFENFALKFTGGIQLPQGMADRKVQFAVLSDDGAILSIINPSSSSTIINNDGNHPTKMGCSAAPVQISANSRLKFELDYYQGPRRHIAITLLWREWSDSPSFNSNDQWCGQSGNDLFFDSSTSPSTAMAPWNDLMTRWEVVPSTVFHVDGETEATNPCHNNH